MSNSGMIDFVQNSIFPLVGINIQDWNSDTTTPPDNNDSGRWEPMMVVTNSINNNANAGIGTRSITDLPTMTVKRHGCSVVSLWGNGDDESFMILGGRDGVCETKSIEIWKKLTIRTPISATAAAAAVSSSVEDGKDEVVGGNQQQQQPQMEREVWTVSVGREMITQRLGCVAVTVHDDDHHDHENSNNSQSNGDSPVVEMNDLNDETAYLFRGANRDRQIGATTSHHGHGRRRSGGGGRSSSSRNEYVIVVGGHNGRAVATTAERYHPRLDMWTESTPSPPFGGVFDAAAVGIGHRMYVLGGHDGKVPSNDVRVFDSNFCAWESGPSMIQRRFQFGAAVSSVPGRRCIYAVGGNDGTKDALRSVERYDLSSKTWTVLPSMSVKRKGCVAAVGIDDKLYVFGGHDGRRVLNSCERYDPQTQSWSKIPSMRCRRFGSAVTVVHDKIFIVGGLDGTDNVLQTIEQYVVKPTMNNTGASVVVTTPSTTSNGRSGGVVEPSSSGPPNELLCPITSDIMVDPVVAADGYSYERQAIEEWFRQFHVIHRHGGGAAAALPRSPTTNKVLTDTKLIPNHNLRSLCRQWHGI
jgi:hypothetical protein